MGKEQKDGIFLSNNDMPTTLAGYKKLEQFLFKENIDKASNNMLLREIGKKDLYFLCRYILGRPDMEHQWILDRCKEVQTNPDWQIDLWARGHFKSSVITIGLTIQDIINNPNNTYAIFSNTRTGAKKFLRQIKYICESNKILKTLYSDIFYENPEKESPKWSENDGLVMKRIVNKKESTVEAWGVIDGQPTGSHFDVLILDDIVTEQSVNTDDIKGKTLDGIRLLFFLVSQEHKIRIIGTRYAFDDAYGNIIKSGRFKPRIYPATDNGKVDGNPVFLTKKQLADKRKELGDDFIFSCQMLQNPQGLMSINFKEEWLRYYEPSVELKTMNYIVVDPANSKKKKSDYTTMWVIGTSADKNYYVRDCIKDKLNLTERYEMLYKLYRKYNPLVIGYEQYGMVSDITYFEEKNKENKIQMRFVSLGGKLSKIDRIRRLVPAFQTSTIQLLKTIPYIDLEGKSHCFINEFVEQYKNFPNVSHDDMLDALARILDEAMCIIFPDQYVFGRQEEYKQEFVL